MTTDLKSAIGFRDVLSALPDFAFAAVCLITWINPYAFGQKMVLYLVTAVTLEFIIVHSAGFMSLAVIADYKKVKKLTTVAILALIYTLFAGSLSHDFGVWWPLAAFWTMTANRMSGILTGQAPSGREKTLIGYSWACGVFFYMFMTMVTVMLPVPALGITEEVVQRMPGRGLWVEAPHRAVAFGFLYFTCVAVSELFAGRFVAKTVHWRMDFFAKLFKKQ
jgi:hypothetical protein